MSSPESGSSDILKENLYRSPLALEEELPRLAAQARLLYAVQRSFVPEVELPPGTGPDQGGKFLDLGAGPGVHLAMVRELFPGFSFTGLELSEELFQYSKLNHPDIEWVQASAYQAPFPDQSFDIVQTSFLLIHLREINRILGEINRLLKPGGVYYAIDVDDSTFKGFPAMETLIKKHLEIYEGDRTIMSRLKGLAETAGLELIKEQPIVVNNQGNDDQPRFDYPSVSLGKMTFWAMFSFMGQRREVHQEYEVARRDYMAGNDNYCEITVMFQAYRKKETR